MSLFQSVSVHGIPQIFDSKKPFYKRICWIAIVIISIIGSSYFILETIRRYQSHPVYEDSYVASEMDGMTIELPDMIIRYRVPKTSIPAFKHVMSIFESDRLEIKYYGKVNGSLQDVKAGTQSEFIIWSSSVLEEKTG